jgi:hypothetical protein
LILYNGLKYNGDKRRGVLGGGDESQSKLSKNLGYISNFAKNFSPLINSSPQS